MRPSWLLSLGLSLCLGGTALAGARLGRFDSQGSSTNRVQVGTNPATVSSTSPAPAGLKFQLRPERNRLYVSIAPRAGLGEWRQSFLLTSDRSLPDGSRVIEYQRPTGMSRSSTFNLKAHNGAVPSGNGVEMLAMSGGGKIELTAKGGVTWQNLGVGLLGFKDDGVARARFEWNETFVGQRSK